jgi:hypothetical protein
MPGSATDAVERAVFSSWKVTAPVCLRCTGLDDLEFLPVGDALLTRRVKAKRARYAVVVRFQQKPAPL